VRTLSGAIGKTDQLLLALRLEARLEDEKQCILVLIGATPSTRLTHGDRADAGHHLALAQMAVADDAGPSIVGLERRMPGNSATSASTACARRSRAPRRKTSVS
jgi:hypothetical protein